MEIIEWNKETQLKSFIDDINSWNNNKNTLENIYFFNKINSIYNMDNTDYEVYKNLNYDIKVLNWKREDIEDHYLNYGINEGRISCEKDFYSLYPDFDIEFYKEFYMDIKEQNWNKYELMGHYSNFGINEGRISCEKDFYSLYPDFDIEFYKEFYMDIKAQNWNKYELMGHYSNFGINEERLSSEKDFFKLHPDFDIDFYKDFNPELYNLNKLQILFHYYHIGYTNNKKYFNFDYIINDQYIMEPLINNETNNFIYNHFFYKSIDTYEKLINYREQYEKKYFIYNKNSFYEYYRDFDFEFYKNKYFLNCECSEKEILLYYHLTGRLKKDVVNNKIKIIVYSPPLNMKCGGLVVMHYFVQLINSLYNDKFIAKLFTHNNIKYDNPFCKNFATLDEINDNCFVIYPEIVSGNPLNAKNVIRWILLELGIEMPLNHYNNWSSTDLIYHWEKIDKQLTCPFFNNIFKNNNTLCERVKTCYLFKKGRLLHKDIKYIHPSDSICIDDLSLNEINDVFNECKYFYSYDPNSAYIIYATVCGCVSIIYEMDGINEEKYFKEKIFNLENQIYNKGIVYGNNIDKINYILENKLNENNEEYYRKLFDDNVKNTVPKFLNDLINIK